MLHEEFSSRLQRMCKTLGFENAAIPESGNFDTLDNLSNVVQNCSDQDAVILLSCKVHYNPNWGGFCGHPQLLNPIKANKDELCPTEFLAPFLKLYTSAKREIYLTETIQGEHLITLPKDVLENDETTEETALCIALDKVAEADKNGSIVPFSTSGSTFSYKISAQLRKTLDDQNYSWNPGRRKPIGQHLRGDMFFFASVGQDVDQNNPFHATLSPYLNQIVSYPTPHLRAAKIHLQQEFTRLIALLTAERPSTFPKLLCLAGLDIDMTPFAGHGKKYFVPWTAYLETVDDNGSEGCSLNQDDLFGQLIQ